jgi:hypothetical protein
MKHALVLFFLSLCPYLVLADHHQVIPAENVFVFERTGCYGNCPAYSVMLFESGLLVFSGDEFTKLRGVKTEKVPQELFHKIQVLLKENEFNTFEESYSFGDICKESLMDLPSSRIYMQYANKVKEVFHDHGCRGFERESDLEGLEAKIDDLLGTEKWVIGF